MQTMILKIDESYLNSIIEFIKPLPQGKCEYKIVENNYDINFDFFDDEEAYQNGLEDLKNGEAIDFDTYLANRGIA